MTTIPASHVLFRPFDFDTSCWEVGVCVFSPWIWAGLRVWPKEHYVTLRLGHKGDTSFTWMAWGAHLWSAELSEVAMLRGSPNLPVWRDHMDRCKATWREAQPAASCRSALLPQLQCHSSHVRHLSPNSLKPGTPIWGAQRRDPTELWLRSSRGTTGLIWAMPEKG